MNPKNQTAHAHVVQGWKVVIQSSAHRSYIVAVWTDDGYWEAARQGARKAADFAEHRPEHHLHLKSVKQL